MTEEQIKYQKKKNALIYIMMFLLVAFVALICYIVVYSKLHPPKKYISQDDIAVVQMNSSNYTVRNTPVYTKIEESTEYKVKKGSTEYQLVLKDNTVKLQEDDETLTDVVLKLNDTDINGKIKIIYQVGKESLILTTDGALYRPLDNVLSEDNTMSVGQILNNVNVKSIIEVNLTKYPYVLSEDNKIISTNDGNEYNGVINVLDCTGGQLYIYEDYSIGVENGQIFVNSNNTPVKLNMLFNNYVIDLSGNIYEIDFVNKTMSTSKLGIMQQIAYNRGSDNKYTVTIETNTGNYTYTSDYYYTK
ncbi:MAG: hypothetical protein MR550_03400 [Bacilli bacterium]|nr:hypothetical protein [Bacilli bacterium]